MRVSAWRASVCGVALALAAAACSGDPADIGIETDAYVEVADRPAPAAAAEVREADCPQFLTGVGLTCHLATVPIDWSDPSAGHVGISVAVRPGSGDGSRPPLAVLQGGPGEPSTSLAAFLPTRPYAQVLIDQRGTGFGSADFTCREHGEIWREVLEDPREKAERLEEDALAHCAGRLRVHPAFAHTTTEAHAADVAFVMDALGYSQWLLYGVSYGTTIALEVLRLAPAGLTGAVLDGVHPGTGLFDDALAQSADRIIAELDDACAADPACAAILADVPAGSGGTIAALLDELVPSLNTEPVLVSLAENETSVGEPLDVWVDGDQLAQATFAMLYADIAASLVPGTLAGLVREAEGTALTLVGALRAETTFAGAGHSGIGTYHAVGCREWLVPSTEPPGRRSAFASALVGDGLASDCALWEVAAMPTPALDSVHSDLPVLLISARYDPITPPERANEVARHLPGATNVVSNVRAHGVWVWGWDSCIDRIVGDFVADPGADLDTACTLEERPLRWLPLMPLL